MFEFLHGVLAHLPLQTLFEPIASSMTRLPNVLVLLVCAALLAAQVLSARRFRRQLAARNEALHTLEDELRALLSCSRGLGEQIHKQQRQMRMLLERQAQIDQLDSGAQGYRQAVVLLQKGASSDDLMGAC